MMVLVRKSCFFFLRKDNPKRIPKKKIDRGVLRQSIQSDLKEMSQEKDLKEGNLSFTSCSLKRIKIN